MVRWKLFRQRIHCGISFTSAIFTSTKMQSLRRHSAIASAFRIHNFLNKWKIFARTICSTNGTGISQIIKRCPRWSCSFLVCFVTLVVGGPSMTVKSPLPLIRMFTGLFSVFSLCLAVQFFTKMGANTCKFARGSVKHEGVQHGWVPCHRLGRRTVWQQGRSILRATNAVEYCIHTTNRGPGRWNDQTMVRLDSFIAGIRDGRDLDDVSFELLALDKKGRIKKLWFSGVYLIVDNGYLD